MRKEGTGKLLAREEGFDGGRKRRQRMKEQVAIAKSVNNSLKLFLKVYLLVNEKREDEGRKLGGKGRGRGEEETKKRKSKMKRKKKGL